MTWTKLGDDFFDRPAMDDLSRSAQLLLIELYVLGNRELRDGEIPLKKLAKATTSDHAAEDLTELAAAGLVEVDDGTIRLDWSEQEPADIVRKRRQNTAKRQQVFRDRKRRHEVGDHSLCDTRRCAKARDVTGDVTGDVTRYVTSDVTAPRPDPDPTRRKSGPGSVPRTTYLCEICTRDEESCRAADSNVSEDNRHEFVPRIA